jgi:hypothetical protein
MAERNIKEGGYQPLTDPPPPPNGPVPPQAVNPITANPNQYPPGPSGSPGQDPAPPRPSSNEGD